jgi:signal transduction histidine kinase
VRPSTAALRSHVYRTQPSSHPAMHRPDTSVSTTLAARDAVIATVAHDLRNPLGAIQMTLEMVLDTLLPNDDAHSEVRRQLGVARRAARAMETLVGDLFDSALIGAGQMLLHLERQTPAEIVGAALELLEPSARARGVAVSTCVDPALPAILADRTRIARVFSNLGANAIRFTPCGGGITIGAVACDGGVCFTVTDTGIGIPPHDVPRVFDRFWRAKEQPSSGAGLGLAIAKEIVEAHGGTIWVESWLGHGSRFSFVVATGSNEKPNHPPRTIPPTCGS